MSKTDPRIQRISLEEIQEFNHLDLYNLPVNTQGKLVVLAYDTVSKTFVYSYSEGITNNSGKLTLFYGHADDIANFSNDSNKPASIYRPSILGFADGDGIIVEKDSTIESTPPVKRLDFYEVSIKKDSDGNIIEDTYVFRGSLVGQKGDKGDKGDDGESTFLSSAFTRTNDDLSAVQISGGSYVSPLPSAINGYTWSDGIPVGTGAVWMVQTRFRQSDVGTPVKIWSYPSKIVDTQFVIFMFSPSATKPLANPLEGDTAGSNGWYKSSEGINVVWMAIGRQVNGVWPTSWEILKVAGAQGESGKQGESGTAAYSYVPSSMFVRCDSSAMSQVRPVGKYLALNNGVYILQGSDPAVSIGGATYTFTDGIPDYNPSIFPNNSKRIWMIQGVLNSNDHVGPANLFQWGEPKVLADSAVVDFEYRGGISATVAGPKPAPPNGTGTDGWYSFPDDVPGGAFWAAQRNWSDGPGASWVVYQIRGEGGSSEQVYTWRTGQMRDPRSVPGTVSNGAQHACAWKTYLNSVNIYHTGIDVLPKVGDYISWLISGTARLEAGWYSDDISAYRIGANGLVAEVVACAIGNMGKPLAPTLAKAPTGSLDVDIFIYAAPAIGGTVNYKEHRVYRLVYNSNGSTTSTLIGTVPHSTNPVNLRFTDTADYVFGENLFIYTTSVDQAGIESPISDASFIAVCEPIRWYKNGQLSLTMVKDILQSRSGTVADNISYFYIHGLSGAPVVGSTFYTAQISKGPVFNGQDLWYFKYEPTATSVTAYKINASGKVSEIATITPPPPPGTPEVYSISSARSYANICNVKTDYDTVYVVPQNHGFVSVNDRVYRNSALNLPFIGNDIYDNSDVISFKFKNNYNRSFVVSIDLYGRVYRSQQCP